MADPEVKAEVVPEVKVEPVVEAKVEAKPEVKAEGEVKVEAKVEAKPAPEPAPKKDWREDRIATLTAKLNEERDKNAALAAAAKAPPVPAPAPQAGESPAEFEARVQRRAAQIAQQEAFNTKSDAIATAARETYGASEFNARLTNIQSTINQRDPIEVQAYARLMATALDTDDPGKVIFLLGEDPSRAANVLAMSPTKMALEVAKLAIAEPPEVSRAPKPLTLVEANGQADRIEIDPSDPTRADKLSTKEWMARRAKQRSGARA